jgi:hypothetical protein
LPEAKELAEFVLREVKPTDLPDTASDRFEIGFRLDIPLS